MEKYLAAAVTGWTMGTLVFVVVWAILTTKFVRDPADKRMPTWPSMWAMSVAFVVIALSWSGLFRGD
jgi:cytochrome bd-type quinol oxidase subunit 2